MASSFVIVPLALVLVPTAINLGAESMPHYLASVWTDSFWSNSAIVKFKSYNTVWRRGSKPLVLSCIRSKRVLALFQLGWTPTAWACCIVDNWWPIKSLREWFLVPRTSHWTALFLESRIWQQWFCHTICRCKSCLCRSNQWMRAGCSGLLVFKKRDNILHVLAAAHGLLRLNGVWKTLGLPNVLVNFKLLTAAPFVWLWTFYVASTVIGGELVTDCCDLLLLILLSVIVWILSILMMKIIVAGW